MEAVWSSSLGCDAPLTLALGRAPRAAAPLAAVGGAINKAATHCA